MLKIIDNVDLKELEKFGFVYTIWGTYEKYIYEGRRGQHFKLVIYDNRFIQGYAEGANGDGEDNYIDDTLYNLIKAGLVEKVGEQYDKDN